jgi:hypothetical protein
MDSSLEKVGEIYHIYPEGDTFEHLTDGKKCWCKPKKQIEDAGILLVHNSFDERERYEEGGVIDQEAIN